MEYDWRDDPATNDPQHPVVCGVTIAQGLEKKTNVEIWDYSPGGFLGYGEMGEADYDDDFSNTDWRSECEDERPSALMLQARGLLLSFYDRATEYEKKKINKLSEKLTGWEEEYYECENR